jgi:hypothetical protein
MNESAYRVVGKHHFRIEHDAEPGELTQIQPQARVDGGLPVGAKVAGRDGTHTPALPLTLVKEITVMRCRDYNSIALGVTCRRLSGESPRLTDEVKAPWGYRHPSPTYPTRQDPDAIQTILSGFLV